MVSYEIKANVEDSITEGLKFLAVDPEFLTLTPEHRIGLAIQYASAITTCLYLSMIQNEIRASFSSTSYDTVLPQIKNAIQSRPTTTQDVGSLRYELMHINTTLQEANKTKTTAIEDTDSGKDVLGKNNGG